jgi:hypothetical protein
LKKKEVKAIGENRESAEWPLAFSGYAHTMLFRTLITEIRGPRVISNSNQNWIHLMPVLYSVFVLDLRIIRWETKGKREAAP